MEEHRTENGKWLLTKAYLESNPEITVPPCAEPLFVGARKLLEEGYDPQTLLTTRWNMKKHDSWVPSPIEKLAKLSIAEPDRGNMQIIAYQKNTRFDA